MIEEIEEGYHEVTADNVREIVRVMVEFMVDNIGGDATRKALHEEIEFTSVMEITKTMQSLHGDKH